MRLAQKTPMETILWYGTYVQKTCAYVCVEGKSASGVKGHGRMIMLSTFVDLLLFFLASFTCFACFMLKFSAFVAYLRFVSSFF